MITALSCGSIASIRSMRGLEQLARRDVAAANERSLIGGIHPPCLRCKRTIGELNPWGPV